jgi:hypothetical protein
VDSLVRDDASIDGSSANRLIVQATDRLAGRILQQLAKQERRLSGRVEHHLTDAQAASFCPRWTARDQSADALNNRYPNFHFPVADAAKSHTLE